MIFLLESLAMEQKTFIAKNLTKLFSSYCFLFCKDENTSLKLNQMLSEPGLLPVPLSMLTESPPSLIVRG